MKAVLLFLALTVVASADEPMLTRYFKAYSSLFCGDKSASAGTTLIKDGLEDDELARGLDVRNFFEANNVPFPNGATAHYFKAADLVVVTNTVENLQKVPPLFLVMR